MKAKLFIGHAWDALFGYRQTFVGEYSSYGEAQTARKAHADETGHEESDYAIQVLNDENCDR